MRKGGDDSAKESAIDSWSEPQLKAPWFLLPTEDYLRAIFVSWTQSIEDYSFHDGGRPTYLSDTCLLISVG